ncbi:MAG TPA: helix-turn-helix domain-containing protein [Candidatus Dormibacteraeota bacterium]|jgi:transcriptional regulator with XRE-family HTH domain
MIADDELRFELGRRLRERRTAQCRTLASVALDAGLSVPYVANLESGRGNPTLSALQGLARALGARAGELLAEGEERAAAPPPASLAEFARGARFAREARRLAADQGRDPAEVRRQLLAVMAGMARLPRPLDELDWHRVLDLIVLLSRAR